MKIRNGFVSNSSSASFIVTWQYIKDEDDEDMSIRDILKRLDSGDWHYGIDDKILDKLVENTKIKGNNFITSEFTGMYNWMGDFGDGILPFFVTLLKDSKPESSTFKIIDWEIKSE